MQKAVLWDLDGTLVDSSDHHWVAWRDTVGAEGFELTYAQFLASFGQKNDRIIRGWLGQETTDEVIRRIGDAKEAQYRRLALERGVTALPGATEWVDRLRRDGWRQAIASSAPRQNVEVILQALRLETVHRCYCVGRRRDGRQARSAGLPRRGITPQRPRNPLRRRRGCRRRDRGGTPRRYAMHWRQPNRVAGW